MTAAALTYQYADFVNRVALEAFGLRPNGSGAGPPYNVISDGVSGANQSNDIFNCILDGLMFVYNAFPWSFMRPVVTITCVAGTASYSLPAGTDTIEGEVTYPAGLGFPPMKIQRMPEQDIRNILASNNGQSFPRAYAITEATFDPTAGSSRAVLFAPNPNSNYVLTMTAILRPTMLDATNCYPVGGEVLSSVFMESCLAAMERNLKNMRIDNPMAVHNAALRDILGLAISRDKRAKSIPTPDDAMPNLEPVVQKRSYLPQQPQQDGGGQ